MNPLLAVNYEVGNDVILGALLVGLVIFAGGLLASMKVIKGWIREVVGVKDISKIEIGPQPFVTKMAEEFVTRASFHKHADLNRQHHEKLEKEAKEQITRLETSHNNLAREVSALGSTVDVNGDRLMLMDQKLDRLIERLKA